MVTEASGAEGDLGPVLGQPVTERALARFDQMVARRIAGEPLQYVLGSWAFRSLDLMVDRRVLIPRPETETVVEVALRELDRLGGLSGATTVVDLGTGSGAIALSIAVERPHSRVWATDRSEEALVVAGANLAGVGRAARRVNLSAGSWFDALPVELIGAVQLIVSNPPYVPEGQKLPAEVADWEPTGALYSGPDGADALRVIVTGAARWLTDEGALVCELSPEQAPAMTELAGRHFARVEIACDLAGRERALVASTPLR
jgi:release factor glutamine methyltransferase